MDGNLLESREPKCYRDLTSSKECAAGALEALLEDVKWQREAADSQLASARCAESTLPGSANIGWLRNRPFLSAGYKPALHLSLNSP